MKSGNKMVFTLSFRLYPSSFTFGVAGLLTLLFIPTTAFAVDKIRIAVSNPNMPNLTAAMAQQRGFFKEENLEVEIIRMNPNVAITALATGDVDYCQLFGAVVGAAVAGLPVRIVGGYLDNWPMTLIASRKLKRSRICAAKPSASTASTRRRMSP